MKIENMFFALIWGRRSEAVFVRIRAVRVFRRRRDTPILGADRTKAIHDPRHTP